MASTSKRIRLEKVHADPETGTKVEDPKRNNLLLNDNLKQRTVKWWLACHLALMRSFGIEKTDLSYVFEITKLTSILWTAHTIARQEGFHHSGIVKKPSEVDHSFTFKGREYRYNIQGVVNLTVEVAKIFGLRYDDAMKVEGNWIETVTPYISMTMMFKTRRDEIRTGIDKIQTGKKDARGNKIMATRPQQYGLKQEHHCLLDGVTANRIVKAGMAQSIGPMAQIISYLQNKINPLYIQKWTAAVQKTFRNLLDQVDFMQALIQYKSTKLQTLLRLIADITLKTQSRRINAICFPASMLIYGLMEDAEINHYLSKNELYGPKQGEGETIIDAEQVAKDIKFFNTANKDGYKLWNSLTNKNFKMRGEFTKEKAAQILFHCVFGTVFENLKVLEWMTGMEFNKKSEFGNAFLKKGSSTQEITFKIPEIKRYCKIVCANVTGLSEGDQGQICESLVFSGKRKRVFSSEMYKYFDSAGDQNTFEKEHQNSFDVLLRLSLLKSRLTKNIKTSDGVMVGTTEWKVYSDDKAKEDDDVIECDVNSTKLFYSD